LDVQPVCDSAQSLKAVFQTVLCIHSLLTLNLSFMLPLDQEFLTLYGLYFFIYFSIVIGIWMHSSQFKNALIVVLALSLGINLYLFYDPENFKGGGSLVVLFYSAIVLLLTVISVVISYFKWKH